MATSLTPAYLALGLDAIRVDHESVNEAENRESPEDARLGKGFDSGRKPLRLNE